MKAINESKNAEKEEWGLGKYKTAWVSLSLTNRQQDEPYTLLCQCVYISVVSQAR